MQKIVIIIFISISSLIATPFILGSIFSNNVSSKYEKNVKYTKEMRDSINLFTQVTALIKNMYYKDITMSQIMYLTLKNMLEQLDPNSTLIDNDEYTILKNQLSGRMHGIGIRYIVDNNALKIINPIYGSPASNAGLRTGDLITHINNESVSFMTLPQIRKNLIGTSDTKLSLTIKRHNEDTQYNISLQLAEFPTTHITHKIIKDSLLYIHIPYFNEKTSKEVMEILHIASKKSIYGIILDVRNNPGGIIEQGIQVSDLFLKEGTILHLKGKHKTNNKVFFSTNVDMSYSKPLIVLINQDTASAAEAVAGSLQANNRAIIMGTRSFGKGTVQSIVNINNQYKVKLTTALYVLPSGATIDKIGIIPNIIIKADDTNLTSNNIKTDHQLDYAISFLTNSLNLEE